MSRRSAGKDCGESAGLKIQETLRRRKGFEPAASLLSSPQGQDAGDPARKRKQRDRTQQVMYA